MPWYVLYTKPRQEKKIADALNAMSIEAYCPLITVVRQWSDRKKKVQLPLITSYVFVRIEEHKRDEVFRISGIVRYLFWLGKPALVRDEEIEVLKKYLEGVFSSFEISVIEKNSVLSVSEGPFKGFEGIVKRENNNHIQILLVNFGFLVTIKKQEDYIA